MSHTDHAIWTCPACGMRRYRFRPCAHCVLFTRNWSTGTGAPQTLTQPFRGQSITHREAS